MTCNHDCFNCKLPECTAPANKITKWESEVMKGASGKWERDIIDKNIKYMISQGFKATEISSVIGITPKEYNTAYNRILHEKSRLSVRAEKAAQRKLA